MSNHWKVILDGNNRLMYQSPEKELIPAAERISDSLAQRMVQEALEAHTPYPQKKRPLDAFGKPGGLIRIESGKRAIIVGDLHGRYDNLEMILRDKNNLHDVLSERAHLVLAGDAVHPRSSTPARDPVYENSFRVMLMIMMLKAAAPLRVHCLLGNHDAAHAGGMPALRKDVRLDATFRDFMIRRFGREVYDNYSRFLRAAPAAAKIKVRDEYVLVIHAGQSDQILNEQGLINIFAKGRKSLALRDVLWTRDYDAKRLKEFLKRVGAKFIISGHTGPTRDRAERFGLKIMVEGVAAHAHDLQAIVMAQARDFGYTDLDMTLPLPERLTKLTTADGRPAFRILQRSTKHADKPHEALSAAG